MNKEDMKQKALEFICSKYGRNKDSIDDIYPTDMSEFAIQYAQSQTEELKKEIEELKAENQRLSKNLCIAEKTIADLS